MKPIMEVWLANFDMRLTIDVGKVVGYMTKYIMKPEASKTKGAQAMIRRVLKNAINDGRSVQFALKKAMGNLLGEPIRSKQECCHLIMSRPTVQCSHSFVRINLDNDTRMLALETLEERPDEQQDGQGEEEKQASDSPATIMTAVDAYAVRLEKDNWLDGGMFDAFADNELEAMPLRTFCSLYCVGKRGAHRNKIKKHNGKKVIVFYPRLSSNPHSSRYTDYCHQSLMKYKPWVDNPETTWRQVPDAEDEDVEMEDSETDNDHTI